MEAKPFDAYVAKGLAELQVKSLRDIQVETSLTWAGRACAAARLGYVSDAREYAHEAIEHAALSGEDALLFTVRTAFAAYGIVL
jgi:hypothetical protein